jgi:hypothetical protein
MLLQLRKGQEVVFLSMPKISVKMQQFESNPGFLAHLLNEGVGAKHKLWH